MSRLPLPVTTYDQPGQNAARLVNFYAEAQPAGGKGPVLGRHAPGVAGTYTAGTGPGRGLHAFNGVLYAISGTNLYRVASNGTTSLIGVIPGSNRVYQANNGLQHIIVADGTGYTSDGTTVSVIADADFRPAGPIAFLDNYILAIELGSGRFFGSALADATDWDALDFATAEGSPDKLVSIQVDHRQAILFGETSTEMWWNSGTQGFPFERVPSGFVELGCAGPAATAKQDNSVYWLANDRTARRVNGVTPVRVSQHNVEQAWRGYDRVDDCQVFPYSLNGHLCVVYRFPTANATWVYDVSTKAWHERESYQLGAWAVHDAVEAYGKVWVQNVATGAVGALDADARSEFGLPIVCTWAYANVYRDNLRAFHRNIEAIMDMGNGTNTVPDPQIRLEYSDNSGRNWKSLGQRSLGNTGERLVRALWWRLGYGRDRVYRHMVSDPVPVVLNDAQLTVALGNA